MWTGLALMGFGFVVARFGLFLREITAAGQTTAHLHSTGWSLWIGPRAIALGVAVSLMASLEYYRFISSSAQGRAIPGPGLLAVAVVCILAVLGVMTALYLIVVSY